MTIAKSAWASSNIFFLHLLLSTYICYPTCELITASLSCKASFGGVTSVYIVLCAEGGGGDED